MGRQDANGESSAATPSEKSATRNDQRSVFGNVVSGASVGAGDTDGENKEMPDRPRSYGEEYLTSFPGPLRLRIGCTTDQGDVTRFLVQLEYAVDTDWRTVVRYDHDPEGPDEMTHDVTEDGLHMDIYRDGDKVDSETVTDPLPPDEGFTHAEEHLMTNLKEVVRRFEQWHGIKSR